MGIRSLQTPGRNNRLATIFHAIQQQLKEELEKKNQEQKKQSLLPPNQSNLLPIVNSGFEADVAVLLSGGVDSSVALNLLLQQGLKPKAFYLKIWLEDELSHLNECPWEEDWSYASAVCNKAGVELEAVPFQKEYWDRVVNYTIAEAKAGRTPNPDIMCNSRVKFGAFYDYIGERFPLIATGHYARSEHNHNQKGGGGGGKARLLRSPDRVKDQTYFLSGLRQEQVARAVFPIGGYTKPQVRELAESMDLPTKQRKDSQGICFLGKVKFDEFIGHYLGENPGQIWWIEGGVTVGK